MKVKWEGLTLTVEAGFYINSNRKYIDLYKENSYEPYVSCDYPVYDAPLKTSHEHIYIKDYSENEGVAKALINAGVLHPEIYNTIESGFIKLHEYKLTDEALKELWPQAYDANYYNDDPSVNDNMMVG